jgi:2-amino-4-hydroxy-6-hydroxymethyldihydropteridine diphosphokinase
MNTPKIVYFSIGSNLGHRLKNLQEATKQLEKRLGKIKAASPVFETPSWGFSSTPFYNACVSIETTLSAQEILALIIAIEESLGRKRTEESGYQARTIDIDILFYGDEIITTESLKVPHPYLQNRRFVLDPLQSIAPTFKHPILHKTIAELVAICEDDSSITKTQHKLVVATPLDFSQFNFIAIEGNIGAGKTTLASKIAEDFNGKLILEQFADNPFLPKFYEDQQRYAFPLEMSFLAERYQQFTDDTSQLDLFKDFMVSDYDIFKSLIFAKVTLQQEEFKLYRKLFNFMYKEVIKPDVYVYLYQNTERLLENIKKRGRTYEQNIPAEYLADINKSYFNFIKTYSHLNALVIDISDLDFVQNEEDYRFIVKKIHEFYYKNQE